jgi:hypothetical protein
MFAQEFYNGHDSKQNFSPMLLLFLKLLLSNFIDSLFLLQSVTQLIPSGHIYDMIYTCFILFKPFTKMCPIIESVIGQLTFSMPFCEYFAAKAIYLSSSLEYTSQSLSHSSPFDKILV